MSDVIKDTNSFLNKIEELQKALDEKTKEVNTLQMQMQDLQTNLSKLHYDNEIAKYIISIVPGHLYWKNKEGMVLGCNDEQAKTLGFQQAKDLVGKTDFDLYLEEYAADIQKTDQEIMATQEIRSEEEVVNLPNGSISTFFSTKRPLYDPNTHEIIGIIGMSIDISELKQAQKRELRAVAEVTEQKVKAEVELRQAVMILAGSIAHDLRTPLSIVHMNGGFLKEVIPALVNAYHQALDAHLLLEPLSLSTLNVLEEITNGIIEAVDDMNEFIDTILKTLSQSLRKKLILADLAPCSMWHCIHHTLTNYPFVEKQRKLIHWDQKDFEFMGNKLIFVRVLSNLLKNSLEQISNTQRGEIFITTEENDENHILRFKDSAGGVSAAMLPNLFNGYATTKEKGTGIGLAFCKLTLKSFGGDMLCNSSYGDYIEFVLMFPKIVKPYLTS